MLLTQRRAICVARNYAARHNVPWGVVTKSVAFRPWWFPFAPTHISMTVEHPDVLVEVGVHWPRGTLNSLRHLPFVVKFLAWPNKPNGILLPLWVAYPRYDCATIHWRMGDGETYKHRWYSWYRALSNGERESYRQRFPPPPDLWGKDWYAEVADVDADPESVVDLIVGRVP